MSETQAQPQAFASADELFEAVVIPVQIVTLPGTGRAVGIKALDFSDVIEIERKATTQAGDGEATKDTVLMAQLLIAAGVVNPATGERLFAGDALARIGKLPAAIATFLAEQVMSASKIGAFEAVAGN